MIPAVLAASLAALLLAQGPRPAVPISQPSPSPTPVAPTTPTDDFGPDLKAWLDANKLQDQASAAKALATLQRRRAERNLASVDDIAGALSGRAEVRAGEGNRADALSVLDSAISFAPDSAAYQVRRADLEGKIGDAWSALDLALASPLEQGRVQAAVLLGLLIVGGLFAAGFGLGLILRYAAVFSHDVAEGLSGPLKSLSLFMAVLFIALPVAGFMGWGYLPFWWAALFFIFQTRVEKGVSILILAGLALASVALPYLMNQRAVDTASEGKALYVAANGGTSVEGEALAAERLAVEPGDIEWSLLSASLSRRGGRFDEAMAALQTRAAADPRFAHNADALGLNAELSKGSVTGAFPALAAATTASVSNRDKATAFYNLSLLQVNTLAFDPSKESRKKGDGLDAALLARFDRLYSFDRDGSKLQAPPDITPDPARIIGSAIPAPRLTPANMVSRLTLVALALLLLIPAIVKFRGVQSFSKQCPKCGTTFCWLCQTRSTSLDVCSQCHHLFVVKRGIPPAARAAKNAEITRYVTRRDILHRVASLAAPGSGHLSVGHITFGLPVMGVWAVSLGIVLTLRFLAPLLVSGSPFGSTLLIAFGALAALTYIAAQVVKPQPPVVVVARRVRPERAEIEA